MTIPQTSVRRGIRAAAGADMILLPDGAERRRHVGVDYAPHTELVSKLANRFQDQRSCPLLRSQQSIPLFKDRQQLFCWLLGQRATVVTVRKKSTRIPWVLCGAAPPCGYRSVQGLLAKTFRDAKMHLYISLVPFFV